MEADRAGNGRGKPGSACGFRAGIPARAPTLLSLASPTVSTPLAPLRVVARLAPSVRGAARRRRREQRERGRLVVGDQQHREADGAGGRCGRRGGGRWRRAGRLHLHDEGTRPKSTPRASRSVATRAAGSCASSASGHCARPAAGRPTGRPPGGHRPAASPAPPRGRSLQKSSAWWKVTPSSSRSTSAAFARATPPAPRAAAAAAHAAAAAVLTVVVAVAIVVVVAIARPPRCRRHARPSAARARRTPRNTAGRRSHGASRGASTWSASPSPSAAAPSAARPPECGAHRPRGAAAGRWRRRRASASAAAAR